MGVCLMQSITAETQREEINRMSLNPTDKDWIDRHTQTLIKHALAEFSAPKGGNKVGKFLRDWGALAITVSVVVAAAIEWNHFTNNFYSFATKTDDRLEQLEKLPEKLDSLQRQINVLHADFDGLRISESLRDLALSDRSEFSKHLPELKKLLDHPVSE